MAAPAARAERAPPIGSVSASTPRQGGRSPGLLRSTAGAPSRAWAPSPQPQGQPEPRMPDFGSRAAATAAAWARLTQQGRWWGSCPACTPSTWLTAQEPHRQYCCRPANCANRSNPARQVHIRSKGAERRFMGRKQRLGSSTTQTTMPATGGVSTTFAGLVGPQANLRRTSTLAPKSSRSRPQ